MPFNKPFLLLITIVLTLTLAGPTAPTPTRAQDDAPTRIIFMHHSTGDNLLLQGEVREGLSELGYKLWDHGYNEHGLRDPAGDFTGTDWNVPDDNTDPDGWYAIFQQEVTDPPQNTFSHMLEYDVIIFKSCFPSSHIADEAMFEQYQEYYLAIRDVIDQHPDKLFIPWTTPPLVPNETDPEAAARARRWAEYLTSDEYLAGHPNIAVFDVFSLWSDEDGFLREDYRQDEWDSHPNELANQTVGPIFVEFIDQTVQDFEPGAAPPPMMDDEGDEMDDMGDEDEMDDGGAADEVIDAMEYSTEPLTFTFEDGPFEMYWSAWSDTGEGVTCVPAPPGYESETALQIDFALATDVYGGCGMWSELLQDWSGAEGLAFEVRHEGELAIMAVIVFIGNPDDPTDDEITPYEILVELPGEDWATVEVYFDTLVVPEWFGTEGAAPFDATAIRGYTFDVGDWEGRVEGTVWLDNVRPLVNE
jgi:hypothetical protein